MAGGLRVQRGGVVLTLSFTVDERFFAAAEEWGDQRMMDTEDALETKVEQALLEIEHLVSGEYEVEFAVDGRTVHYEPTDDLADFLADQADTAGLEAADVLELHVGLFARVFLDEEGQRPPNAPPE